MYSRDIQSLLRVKQVIDHLKAIDTIETEQDAVQDCLEQAYERAAYVLQVEREDTDDATTHSGHCYCYYSA